LFTSWWVADAWAASPVILLARVFWVIFSIVLHELAHGWTAIRCGDRTPIQTGHMTWNPLVHMGQASLIMFAVVGIAWGAMPVNPANFRGRLDNTKVALAGPSMNLLLFVISLTVAGLVVAYGRSMDPTTRQNIYVFFFVGAYFNMALALFNLLPIRPLDGWRIASDLWPGYGRIWERENAQALSLMIFVGIFWFGGPYIFKTAGEFTIAALDFLLPILGHKPLGP
jgi:Zn-dependent protease